MMLNKRLVFLIAVVFLFHVDVFGQTGKPHTKSPVKSATKYFLNQLEIAPQSIQFLDPKDIDSIRFYQHKHKDTDSSVVLYSHKQDSLINFEIVMEDYFVLPEERHFKVNTPNYLGVEEPAKLIFSETGVSNVRVYRSDGDKPGIINISSELEYEKGKPEVLKKMI